VEVKVGGGWVKDGVLRWTTRGTLASREDEEGMKTGEKKQHRQTRPGQACSELFGPTTKASAWSRGGEDGTSR